MISMSVLLSKTLFHRILIWSLIILIITAIGYWRVSEPVMPKQITDIYIPTVNINFENRVGLSLPISVEDPGMKDVGAKWYFNWSHKPHNGVDLEFVPLVWGYPGNGPISTDYWKEVEQAIREYPEYYHDGTLFLIGNEIGYKAQNDGRTPSEYAQDFHTAYSILKSINPSFQISVGPAVLNIEPSITRSIVGADDGLDYLSQVIDRYYEFYGELIPADYFAATNHVLEGSSSVLETFKNRIKDLRQLLYQKGLNNRNLILTEFGVPVRGLSPEEIASVMVDTISFVATASDEDIGHPDDGGKLVQRWAWFTTRPMGTIDKVRYLGWSALVLQLSPTSLFDLDGNPTYLHEIYSTILKDDAE